MELLKLTALDPEDLTVISAHMQDAVVRVGDIAYLPRKGKLAIVANRFGWAEVAAGGKRARPLKRYRCGLHISRVLKVARQNIPHDAPEAVLSLLAIVFRPGKEAPAGSIELVFSGEAALRAEVECIEAALEDLGPAWKTRHMPSHSAS